MWSPISISTRHSFRCPETTSSWRGIFKALSISPAVRICCAVSFRPVEPFGRAAQEWSQRIAASACSVSLHVRRGDYVSNPHAAAVHNAVGEGYYRRAIALMRVSSGRGPTSSCSRTSPTLLSRPLPTCRALMSCARIRAQLGGHVPHGALQPSHHRQQLLFLVGRVAQRVAEKVVIAPGQWFTRERLATTNVMDLYPEGWIILK